MRVEGGVVLGGGGMFGSFVEAEGFADFARDASNARPICLAISAAACRSGPTLSTCVENGRLGCGGVQFHNCRLPRDGDDFRDSRRIKID